MGHHPRCFARNISSLKGAIKKKDNNITLNRTKCEVIGQTASTRAQLAVYGVDLREVELKDAILLGSPLLPGVGVDEVIAAKREELQTLASRLPLMPAHDSLYLLRNVVTTARLIYTLRTAPCTGSMEPHHYDNVVRSSLSTTLNVELTDDAWMQASLPVRWGGGWGSGVQSRWQHPPTWLQPRALWTESPTFFPFACTHRSTQPWQSRSNPGSLPSTQRLSLPQQRAPADNRPGMSRAAERLP